MAETTDAGPEEQRILNRLFNDPQKQMRGFHITRDPDAGPVTREELCGEINRAIDAYERGDSKPLDFGDRTVNAVECTAYTFNGCPHPQFCKEGCNGRPRS